MFGGDKDGLLFCLFGYFDETETVAEAIPYERDSALAIVFRCLAGIARVIRGNEEHVAAAFYNAGSTLRRQRQKGQAAHVVANLVAELLLRALGLYWVLALESPEALVEALIQEDGLDCGLAAIELAARVRREVRGGNLGALGDMAEAATNLAGALTEFTRGHPQHVGIKGLVLSSLLSHDFGGAKGPEGTNDLRGRMLTSSRSLARTAARLLRQLRGLPTREEHSRAGNEEITDTETTHLAVTAVQCTLTEHPAESEEVHGLFRRVVRDAATELQSLDQPMELLLSAYYPYVPNLGGTPPAVAAGILTPNEWQQAVQEMHPEVSDLVAALRRFG